MSKPQHAKRLNKLPVGKQLAFNTAYGLKTIDIGEVTKFIHLMPPKRPPSASLLQPLKDTIEELLKIDKAVYGASPARCFGLEARVAHYLSEKFEYPANLNPRQHLIRPAPEPVTYSYWERFRSWTHDKDSVSALASCLCGRDLGYRDGIAATLPNRDGVSVLYPEPAISAMWLSSIPTPPQRAETLEGLEAAFVALANLILHHPLTDGNGRFGRSLFQGVLARSLGLAAPMLALGPLIQINRPAELRAWLRLGGEGDWSNLIDVYHSALQQCLSYHQQAEYSL